MRNYFLKGLRSLTINSCGLTKKKVGFVIVLLQIIPAAYAEELAEFSENDFTNDIPIVISAARIPRRESEAPESISIIDRDTIKALGVINIADIFRIVPGFQVAHVRGNVFAVAYHGLTFDYPRRLQVLIDGRSVYRPLLSNVDWANLGISVSDIERIEVIRGPNTPGYGTNAFMGTINIVTREPFQDQGYRIEATMGGNHVQKYFIKYASNIEKLEYRVTAEYRKSRGFDQVDDSREITIDTIRAIYNIDAFTNLEMQFGYSGGSMGADGDGSLLNPIRDVKVISDYNYLRWNKALSNVENIHIQFYHNYYEQKDQFNIGTPAVRLGVFDGIGDRTDIEVQHNVKLSDSFRFAWGAGIRRDRIKGELIIDKIGYIKDDSLRIFSSVEWRPIKNTIVNIAAMYENNEIVGDSLSPRIGINYKLENKDTFRVSFSKGYRPPSLYESNNKTTIKQSDGTPIHVTYDNDKDLASEELLSYEIGYIGKFSSENISYDVKLFQEDLSNFIAAPTDNSYVQPPLSASLGGNQAKVWQNSGDVRSRGIEIQLIYAPTISSTAKMSYAYANAEGRLLDEINPNGPDLRDDLSNNIPTHTASMLWQQKVHRDWLGSIAFYHISRMEWGGGGDLVKAYNRWDLYLLKTAHFGKNIGELGLSIQNAANERYNEFRFGNVFERRVYLKFQLSI